MCGVFAFHIILALTWFGLLLMDGYGTILIIHLYKAIRQQHDRSCRLPVQQPTTKICQHGKLIEAPDRKESNAEQGKRQLQWADMDLVISFFKDTALYSGKTPNTGSLDEARRRLRPVLSCPLIDFAADKRDESRAKLAKVKDWKYYTLFSKLPKLIEILFSRYAQNNPINDSTRKVEAFLYTQDLQLHRDKKALLKSKPSGNSQSSSHEPTTLTRSRFVEALYGQLAMNQAWLRFDWLDFHTQCRTFLVALRRHISAEIEVDMGPRLRKTIECHRSALCLEVLEAAASNEGFAETLDRFHKWQKKRGNPGTPDGDERDLNACNDVIDHGTDALEWFVK